MIEYFNEVEARNSGVIYNSTFEQIKKLYAVDPEKAGELAISAIELVLTGQMSSDDVMIDMMLTTIRAINDSNIQKYENKVENSKQKKIREMKLAEIAELMRQGWKQREIGEKLNMSQQNVSYRIGIIRAQYPDLLLPQDSKTAQTTYKQNEQFCGMNVVKETESEMENNTNNNDKPTDGGSNNQPSDKENGTISCISTIFTVLLLILTLI